jgi:hypothetical protein
VEVRRVSLDSSDKREGKTKKCLNDLLIASLDLPVALLLLAIALEERLHRGGVKKSESIDAPLNGSERFGL